MHVAVRYPIFRPTVGIMIGAAYRALAAAPGALRRSGLRMSRGPRLAAADRQRSRRLKLSLSVSVLSGAHASAPRRTVSG